MQMKIEQHNRQINFYLGIIIIKKAAIFNHINLKFNLKNSNYIYMNILKLLIIYNQIKIS